MSVQWVNCCFVLFFTIGTFSVHSQNNSSNSTGNGSSTEKETGISAGFLFKCHGVLMIFSWLLFAPCAILYARFLRDPLMRVLGDQLWFQVHRFLNTLTFICVLISFICTISASGGAWDGPTIYNSSNENFSWPSLHSLFGLITVMLTMFQPISALFRCRPESSARVVFNVLHAFTGYTGMLAALIAISIACIHFHFASTTAATVLIIVFLVLVAIVAVLMQIIAIRQNQQEMEFVGQLRLFIIFTVICSAIAVAISLLLIFH